MKLIIAEKPSLARSIKYALTVAGEHFTACDGEEYYKSEHYYITNQYGHILLLLMPEEYEENKGLKYAPLPYFPKEYQFKVKDDFKRRYETIRKLVNQTDVTEIIHCGDADREGQLLVDVVLERIGNTKPVTRPQFKATTPGAINAALRRRQNNIAYRNTRDEGYARLLFDFDYGINLSNYATRKAFARPALNVGRVKGAILNELYIRDKEIKEFKPTAYYKVISDVDGIKLTAKGDYKTESEALDYANRLQAGETRVKEITESPVTKKHPMLFSQTKLQAAMNKKYGYSPDQTLKFSQSLYEKGLTTYPRTNTEYMTEAEIVTLDAIIKRLNQNGEKFELRTDHTVIDDSKVEGHSAIIVTGKRPENLTEGEHDCYMMIFNRFRAVFCKEPCVYNKTTILITNPLENFKISGETLVSPGWQAYEPRKKKSSDSKNKEERNEAGEADEDNLLPKVTEGELLHTNFVPEQKMTTPPPKYTVTTLGSWMENPFRKELKESEEEAEHDSDDEDYRNILLGLQIGTEATRADILKVLQKKEYISLKKSTYNIEKRGIYLVEVCQELGIDMSKEKTASMNKLIKDVGKGKISLSDAVNIEHEDIADIIKMDRSCTKMEEVNSNSMKCPLCGKPVRENSKAYSCTGWKEGCKFTIWKKVAGKTITESQARKLILTGKTNEIKGFTSKNGKKFDARLKLKPDKLGVEFEFVNHKKAGE